MGSFSNNKVGLFGLNVRGQLAHSLDRVVQRAGFRIVDINVDDTVNVERDVQVDTAGLFVGETVLVLSGCLGLDLFITVI